MFRVMPSKVQNQVPSPPRSCVVGSIWVSSCTAAGEYTHIVLPTFVRNAAPSMNQESNVPANAGLTESDPAGNAIVSMTFEPAG